MRTLAAPLRLLPWSTCPNERYRRMRMRRPVQVSGVDSYARLYRGSGQAARAAAKHGAVQTASCRPAAHLHPLKLALRP
eukprot:835642-Rhodomonas_salina.1